jgi:cell division protease FtsH
MYVCPALVLVLLVYLATQTLLDGSASAAVGIPYSALIRRVERSQPGSPQAVVKVVVNTKTHGLEATLADGTVLDSHYTTDASEFAFERLLARKGIEYDAKPTSSSAWWSVLTYLLPFILFFGFWIFLMRRVGDRSRSPLGRLSRSSSGVPSGGDGTSLDRVVERLDEIKALLERERRF